MHYWQSVVHRFVQYSGTQAMASDRGCQTLVSLSVIQ